MRASRYFAGLRVSLQFGFSSVMSVCDVGLVFLLILGMISPLVLILHASLKRLGFFSLCSLEVALSGLVSLS